MPALLDYIFKKHKQTSHFILYCDKWVRGRHMAYSKNCWFAHSASGFSSWETNSCFHQLWQVIQVLEEQMCVSLLNGWFHLRIGTFAFSHWSCFWLLFVSSLFPYTSIYMYVLTPDEDVRKYLETQKKKAEPPVQVPEVDSCVPRTPERSGITVDDIPGGLSFSKFTITLLLWVKYLQQRCVWHCLDQLKCWFQKKYFSL